VSVSELVADFLLARLTKWGVHRIYGYPGDGINALVGAFDRAGGDCLSGGRASGQISNDMPLTTLFESLLVLGAC
jgi:hypothetical protein